MSVSINISGLSSLLLSNSSSKYINSVITKGVLLDGVILTKKALAQTKENIITNIRLSDCLDC